MRGEFLIGSLPFGMECISRFWDWAATRALGFALVDGYGVLDVSMLGAFSVRSARHERNHLR